MLQNLKYHFHFQKMDNKKKKLIVFAIFVVVIIGGGFFLTFIIPRNSVKKTGYKTKHNPSYIDEKMKEKEKERESQKP